MGAAKVQAKTDRKTSRALATKNAEKYAKEYEAADQTEIDGKRAAKKAGHFYVEGEAKVTFGYPSRHMIKNLIYKRGAGKVNRCRIPLTDNSIIAGELGKHGINCIEDLVHEITTCGPKFKEANNFLWPFKLSSPLGGFEIKRHSFAQGYGAYGNREELINQLIKKMY